VRLSSHPTQPERSSADQAGRVDGPRLALDKALGVASELLQCVSLGVAATDSLLCDDILIAVFADVNARRLDGDLSSVLETALAGQVGHDGDEGRGDDGSHLRRLQLGCEEHQKEISFRFFNQYTGC
jgi:hypothetical protein